MTIREQMARAMCIQQGIDPDFRARGLGNVMPKDSEYALWEAQMPALNAAIDALAIVDHKLLDFARTGLPIDSGTAARFWITAINAIKQGAA